VPQTALQRLADLQAAEWLASQATHKAALLIRQRIAEGASVEPGRLYFDEDLRMVRTERRARRRKGDGIDG